VKVNRLRFRTNNHPEASIANVQINGVGPVGKLTGGKAPVVTGAVVPTVTATVCVPLPVIGTEDGTLQVGAGVAVGVIAQVKFTGPVNPPAGASARLKLAVCPALTVWEVDEPEAAPSEKPGAAVTTSDTGMLFTIDPTVP
jgi:hypothetical protein